MARIRSVHPALFTDEAFVGLSDAAQIFLIGLWTEADDQGVFEWKPMTLRMRLRPTKDGPVETLLSELETAQCICVYEIEGRKLGAIRNFRRFQKPKTPNAIHLTTVTIRNWVGLPDAISETTPRSDHEISEMDDDKPPTFPPKGEKPSLMEDGGGRGGDNISSLPLGNGRARAREPRKNSQIGRKEPKRDRLSELLAALPPPVEDLRSASPTRRPASPSTHKILSRYLEAIATGMEAEVVDYEANIKAHTGVDIKLR